MVGNMNELDIRIIDGIIEAEGGAKYTNDPDDRGGPTKYGITLKTLAAWRKEPRTIPGQVEALTEWEAREIYWDRYIKPFAYIVDPCVKNFVVNCAVQHGPGRAKEFITHVMEPYENEKLPTSNQAIVLKHLIQERATFYDDIIRKNPAQRKFKRGWIGRISKDLTMPSPLPQVEMLRLAVIEKCQFLWEHAAQQPFRDLLKIEALK